MASKEESVIGLPKDGFSRWNDLAPLAGMSRETIRQRELQGKFPRRIHLTKRCAVWKNQELHRFFADPLNYRAEAA
ncbi:AlpA family phage regulatory protein [Paraburkholderia sp. USG1]|uniref:helix-turn-helix transcriptional regulator n=1 Tax=Paraburkholderia sp. USG1 TaxID=2952268 RepID=UPI00285423F8|nr:AlpA family phage regulatory protein [Paraburkholderia sp. USG1]MDR8396976.1 AlpA family phage regulatory protein [Paraburkholderia sp. USG1]